MPYSNLRVPTYCHRKSRDLAVVTINGQDVYLGKYNSPESKKKYDRLIQEWLATGRSHTSATLILAYMQHATVFYRKDGKPTSHLHNVEDAMTYLKNFYGLEPLKDFGPLKLRQHICDISAQT
jgi:hypothetical protein